MHGHYISFFYYKLIVAIIYITNIDKSHITTTFRGEIKEETHYKAFKSFSKDDSKGIDLAYSFMRNNTDIICHNAKTFWHVEYTLNKIIEHHSNVKNLHFNISHLQGEEETFNIECITVQSNLLPIL